MTPDPVRTHAERRSATIDRVLNATIASLAEQGYAATSTRAVADRAGVSLGALQHYFPTKLALIEASMTLLIDQVVAATDIPPAGRSERVRLEAVLDRLWEIHNLPIAAAVFELITVARTDPELAAVLPTLVERGVQAMEETAKAAAPNLAREPGFRIKVHLAVATIRGLAVLAQVPGVDTTHAPWPQTRRLLLAQLITHE